MRDVKILAKPSRSELRDAREELSRLIQGRAKEHNFQDLFSRCPYLLSESLPLRLRPTEIRPLARPGKSDPDFIIVPRSGQLDSIGVIELKRPSTTLITKPRKEIALLSRDVATAIAQGQEYCKKLRAELAQQFSRGLAITSNEYIFIIAGLTDEVIRKLDSFALYECLRTQLNGNCQVIPYDELLKRFDAAVPPMIFSLSPFLIEHLRDLETIIEVADENVRRRQAINEENFDFWSSLEDRWRAGNYIGSTVPRIIDRSWWCISGTNILATESPAHIEFPNYIEALVAAFRSSLKYQDLLQKIQNHSYTVRELKEVITKRQLKILDEAISRCRKNQAETTFLDPNNPLHNPDVEVLVRLGCLTFETVESCDFWYRVDQTLVKLWE